MGFTFTLHKREDDDDDDDATVLTPEHYSVAYDRACIMYELAIFVPKVQRKWPLGTP
jgi:hypothetical protein